MQRAVIGERFAGALSDDQTAVERDERGGDLHRETAIVDPLGAAAADDRLIARPRRGAVVNERREQRIEIVVEGESLRSRLLSPREAARLMGLNDDYILPERYNDAYHVAGDGVCVPVVSYIASQIIEPILGITTEVRAAA